MTALSITAANVIAGANAVRKSGTAGETIVAGKSVYLNSTTEKWMLADADSATAEANAATGIALNGASLDQPVDVIAEGDLTLGAVSMTPGAAYYLGDTAGSIVPFADLNTGDKICQIGSAKSATVLAVKPTQTGVTA